MRYFNARTSNQGFTLIEILTVVAMVGILSAIAAPSFMSMYARAKLNEAVTQVRGALQEAQRQAIRTSRSCTVTITSSQISAPCLATGNRTFSDPSLTSLRTSTASFQFNLKGVVSDASGTSLTQPVTIVISSGNFSVQRCIVVSTPLGLIKTGNYSGAANTTSDSSCLPRP